METDSRQLPIFNVRQFIRNPYPEGSFFHTLEQYGHLIILAEDFPEVDHELGGKDPWCKILLSKLVLIQRKHGWKDRETVQRATTDLQVKACLGLGVEAEGPSQPTLCRHRKQMEELGLAKVYMSRFANLLKALGLLTLDTPVAVDSVPVRGAGQVKDTYNLLGSGIRQGLTLLAKRLNEPVQDVASRLELSAYLGRSVKGTAKIDWRSQEERRAFLTQLVDDAQRLQAEIERQLKGAQETKSVPRPAVEPTEDPDDNQPALPGLATPPRSKGSTGLLEQTSEPQENQKKLQLVSAMLAKIIAHDVSFGPNGEAKIRRKRAGGRLISTTDIDMRHGRKSSSVLIAGYKAQIVATVLHAWILLTKIIPANRHDGKDLPELIQDAAELGLNPKFWIGDHAYGTLDNHAYVRSLSKTPEQLDVELVARNARPPNGDRFTKDEFEIDFEQKLLTCPAGTHCPRTRWVTQNREKAWLFRFPAQTCQICPLKQRCIRPDAVKNRGRSVVIVEKKERLIREHLKRRQETDFIQKLKMRQVVERVNSGFVQCGGHQAQRFGVASVDFDAQLSALAYNIRTLGAILVKSEQTKHLIGRVDVMRLAFFCFFYRARQQRFFGQTRLRQRLSVA